MRHTIVSCFLSSLYVQFLFDEVTSSLFVCSRKSWLSLIRYSLFSDFPLYPGFFIFLQGSEILGQLVSTDICIASSKCVFILFYYGSCEYLPTDVHIESVSDLIISVLHCVWLSSLQERQKNVAPFSSLHLSLKKLVSAIASVIYRNTSRKIVEKQIPQVKGVAGKLPPYTLLLPMLFLGGQLFGPLSWLITCFLTYLVT
jgi:hypothetical protein